MNDFFQQAYLLFNNRNIDSLFKLMHPDVDWPNGWEGGFVKGYDEVRTYWTRQWLEIDPDVQPMDIKKLPDGRVKILVHQTVKDLKGNLLNESDVIHVYTLRDGLISRMDIEAAG